MRHICWLLLPLSFLIETALLGQDTTSLSDRLRATDTGSSLVGPDAKPWHLKMTVQLFDRKGQASDQGTIEEWWSSPKLDRREYQTKGYTATEIRAGGKVFRTRGVDLPPYFLELLRQQVVHPISAPEKIDASMQKLNVGKLALDCIELGSPGAPASPTVGVSPTYCVDAGSTSLRVTLDYTIQEIVRTAIGKFQGKEVAVDAVVSGYGIKAAAGHVDSLKSEVAAESEFALSAETPEVVPLIASSHSGGGTAAAPISTVFPHFPVQAKAQNVTAGIVVLRAVVGTDGRVRSVTAIASSNPVFESEALDATRQWRYQPSTLEGQPAELETVTVTHFTNAQPGR